MSFNNEDTEKPDRTKKIFLGIAAGCIVLSIVLAVLIYGGFI
jgi:hypothetical protein